MASKHTLAMSKATAGNRGYMGTLKGRSISGSFFLSANKEIIATIYKVKAPKQAMVMISPVLPVSKAMMPMIIFTTRAFDGVLNLA